MLLETSRQTERSLKRSVVLPRALALLLLFAAAAKSYAAWQITTWRPLTIAEIAIEALLAMWLFTTIARHLAICIALMLFAGFASISLVETHRGVSSCGCFGPIQVPPRAIFLLDSAIVSLLILQLPGIRMAFRAVGSVVAPLIGVGTLLLVAHQPIPPPPIAVPSAVAAPPNAIAQPVSSWEWVADLGTIPPGKTWKVLFRLTSPNGHRLQIRGVNVSCGCTSIPHPPDAIPATGTIDVQVILKPLGNSGSLDDRAVLTTDDPQLPPLTLRIKAQIQ
jgi:hypothetical protein